MHQGGRRDECIRSARGSGTCSRAQVEPRSIHRQDTIREGGRTLSEPTTENDDRRIAAIDEDAISKLQHGDGGEIVQRPVILPPRQ